MLHLCFETIVQTLLREDIDTNYYPTHLLHPHICEFVLIVVLRIRAIGRVIVPIIRVANSFVRDTTHVGMTVDGDTHGMVGLTVETCLVFLLFRTTEASSLLRLITVIQQPHKGPPLGETHFGVIRVVRVMTMKVRPPTPTTPTTPTKD